MVGVIEGEMRRRMYSSQATEAAAAEYNRRDVDEGRQQDAQVDEMTVADFNKLKPGPRYAELPADGKGRVPLDGLSRQQKPKLRESKPTLVAKPFIPHFTLPSSTTKQPSPFSLPIRSSRDALYVNVPHSKPVGSYDGRTVRIGADEGKSVARFSQAFSQLNRVLRDNKVRADMIYQRYYEKPTAKRTRLRSERHRARFNAAITKLVNIVKQMKARGV